MLGTCDSGLFVRMKRGVNKLKGASKGGGDQTKNQHKTLFNFFFFHPQHLCLEKMQEGKGQRKQ